MAFLDLTVGAPPVQGELRGAHGDRVLDAQERKIVLLARTDPVSSLQRSGIHRVMRILFGIEPPHRLADQRLEALRRFAVLYRVHGSALPMREIERALAAGHSESVLARARALIDRTHGVQVAPRTALSLVAPIVVLAIIAWIAVVALVPVVDSAALAIVLTGVGFASVLPLLAGSGVRTIASPPR